MGASLGARSCMWAASRPGVTVAGVIGVSTPEKAVAAFSPGYDFTAELIGSIEEPKLFLAGDQDEDYDAQVHGCMDLVVEVEATPRLADHRRPLLGVSERPMAPRLRPRRPPC